MAQADIHSRALTPDELGRFLSRRGFFDFAFLPEWGKVFADPELGDVLVWDDESGNRHFLLIYGSAADVFASQTDQGAYTPPPSNEDPLAWLKFAVGAGIAIGAIVALRR